MEQDYKYDVNEKAFESARSGNLDAVRDYIEHQLPSAAIYDKDHVSLLGAAVESGNYELIEYLTLLITLSPLDSDYKGETVYDIAKRLGNTKALELFNRVTGFSWEESFHNPVRRGFNPDPSMIRVGEYFYMVNSSFTFFPCLPISKSKDLVHWERVAYAIDNPEWAGLEKMEGGRGYWAPDISTDGRKFYITVTLRGNDGDEHEWRQVIVSADSPEGPYGKPCYIDDGGIDPSLFHDDDGRHYMLVNKGARIIELNEDCSAAISDSRLIWFGSNKYKPEGPHMFKRNGYYYLILAEGGTGRGHCMTCARSKNIYGPYEPSPFNPIMHQYDESAFMQCCGHGQFVDLEDGRTVTTFLCTREFEGKYPILGRESSIEEINWTPEGWPYLRNGEKIPAVQRKKFLPDAFIHENSRDYYPRWKGFDFISPRGLLSENISIVPKDTLILKGSDTDINSLDFRSALLVKQEQYNFTEILSLKASSITEGGSAGICSYYDENSFLTYGITIQNGKLLLLFMEYVGDSFRIYRLLNLSSKIGDADEICLKMEVSGMERKFFVKTPYGWDETDQTENTEYLLSSGLSKGKRFTGATTGLYASSCTAQFVDFKIV